MTDVLCAGIIVADHVCTPIPRLPEAGELVMAERLLLTLGGCAANAAVDLAKMGFRAKVVARVGGDAFGRIVTDLLHEQGVDVSGIRQSADLDTSQTLILNVTSEDRRFIHSFGANAEFSAADLPEDLVRQCKVLYVGGYLLMPGLRQADLLPIFRKAREAGVRTVLDVAIPKPGAYLAQLEQLLPHVDVFLPNNDEAELITGESDPLRQAELFHKMGARTAVVTRGVEGAVLISDQIRLRSGVFTVPYVDGSGGGDAFDAGYICGMLKNLAVEDCLRLASALGASCVRALGTTPGVFTREECESFLSEHTLHIETV